MANHKGNSDTILLQRSVPESNQIKSKTHTQKKDIFVSLFVFLLLFFLKGGVTFLTHFILTWGDNLQHHLESSLIHYMRNRGVSSTGEIASSASHRPTRWLDKITVSIKAFTSMEASIKRHNKGGDISKDELAALSSLISWGFVLGLKKFCDLHFKSWWSKTITLLLLYFSHNKWIRLQTLVSTRFFRPCCTDSIWSFLQ